MTVLGPTPAEQLDPHNWATVSSSQEMAMAGPPPLEGGHLGRKQADDKRWEEGRDAAGMDLTTTSG